MAETAGESEPRMCCVDVVQGGWWGTTWKKELTEENPHAYRNLVYLKDSDEPYVLEVCASGTARGHFQYGVRAADEGSWTECLRSDRLMKTPVESDGWYSLHTMGIGRLNVSHGKHGIWLVVTKPEGVPNTTVWMRDLTILVRRLG